MRSAQMALLFFAALGSMCAAQSTPPPAQSAPAKAALPGAPPGSPLNQTSGTPGPDGKPVAIVSNGCVFSQYFGFSLRLPAGMTSASLSALPAGGININPTDLVLFVADRGYQIPNYTDDVVEAAVEYRGQGADASASNFLLQLRNRPAVPNGTLFADFDSAEFGAQRFARLPFQQTMPDGLVTYESIDAAQIRGYVVYFIFRSLDPDALARLEQSMATFAQGNQCVLRQ